MEAVDSHPVVAAAGCDKLRSSRKVRRYGGSGEWGCRIYERFAPDRSLRQLLQKLV